MQIVRWMMVGLVVLVGVTVWQSMNHRSGARQNWNHVATKSVEKLQQDAKRAERSINAAKQAFNGHPAGSKSAKSSESGSASN